jgi:LysM repeat protein
MKFIPRSFLPLMICLAASCLSIAQEPANPDVLAYISRYRETAIREMQRTGVPASIKLAQGILETEAGKSSLVLRSNNHFGIKCKSSWTGEKVYHDDDEQGECFRKYDSAEDSWRDHSDFLRSQPRYASLFTLDPMDHKGWAYGLKQAGYATNPRYPEILIKYIENYRLDEVSMLAINGKTDIPDISDKGQTPDKPGDPTFNASSGDISPAEPTDSPSPRSEDPGSYPSGEFTRNDTRVIFAGKGSSLLALAETSHLRLGQLLEFNDLPPGTDILEKGQLIYLQRKRKEGLNAIHVTAAGESLHDIAQSEGIRMENLLAYNRLAPGATPFPGQQLHLKEPTVAGLPPVPAKVTVNVPDQSVKTPVPAPQTETDFIMHRVQAGETLYALSRKYATGVEQIRSWNDLKTDQLQTGQMLRILKSR